MKPLTLRIAFAAVSLLLSASVHAESSKKMAIFNWADYFGETTIADFTKASGIEVQYDTFPAPEVLETKLLTGGSGYDVVFPSASLTSRIAKAGVFAPIDVTRLKNYANLDPDILNWLKRYDNGEKFGVPYTWGTIGISYNEKLIKDRLGDAPVDNLDMLFKPEITKKFADCGIAIIDSPIEVISIALNYLGLDPHSNRAEDIDKAQALLAGLQPNVRYFDSTRPIQDLASGEICLALTYSGDAGTAQLRASEAKSAVTIGYAIPTQGTVLWMDLMAIPKDAPNPDNAYAFIDYLLQPEVIAGMTNYLTYANANIKSQPLIDEAIRNNPGVFPPPEVKARLFPDVTLDDDNVRLRNRAWTKVKSGL
ncbi:MAG: polyamine ABC transporter substrate-binding protein [Gammaproteobacteria bacterium]